jgi:hypothetical protein
MVTLRLYLSLWVIRDITTPHLIEAILLRCFTCVHSIFDKSGNCKVGPSIFGSSVSNKRVGSGMG